MVCVKRCCCCVNLRVGGIMMGVMTLALSVFSLIPMTLFLVYRLFLARVVTHLVEEYSNSGGDDSNNSVDSVAFWGVVTEAISADNNDNLPPEDDPNVEWLAYAMLIFFIISLILLVIFAICSILLIYGATKGKRWFLVPWIICTFAFILAYFTGMVLSLWLVGLHVLSVVLFFIALIEIVVALYLWVCVISLHQFLGSEVWRSRNDRELKLMFSTKYNGVPQEE